MAIKIFTSDMIRPKMQALHAWLVENTDSEEEAYAVLTVMHSIYRNALKVAGGLEGEHIINMKEKQN